MDIDHALHQPEAIKEFTRSISQYRVETDLDRKLLLGVLVRDAHLEGQELLTTTFQHNIYPTLIELVGGDAEY